MDRFALLGTGGGVVTFSELWAIAFLSFALAVAFLPAVIL